MTKTALCIDGKQAALVLCNSLADATLNLQKEYNVTPGLAVILVGTDPASQVYVGSKIKQTRQAGMNSFEHVLPATISQHELLSLVHKLNQDETVDGILVQMPLPAHINTAEVVRAITPEKDVDGLHPYNAGQLVLGENGLVPCTPQGCMMLICDQLGTDLCGKRAVVLGRSILVGKPMALLLLAANATVTIVHSRSLDIEQECRQADILVAAVGRPHIVKSSWVKPGACVIDVGINRVEAPEKGEGKTRLVGDVDYENIQHIAGSITPVPGGVGPMTVACLLANTLKAACLRRGLAVPQF